MATNRIHIDAPPQAVFDVLCDAASYRVWVVGSKRIRGVDPEWPAVGSRFHHTIGIGPFFEHDTSRVLESQPPNRLVLEARIWPFGTAEVALDLHPAGAGTDVVFNETPLAGPAKHFENRAMQGAIWLRNTLTVRRLKQWAEQRYHATPGVPPEPPG